MIRLAIAVPTRDYVPALFANDLAELYAATQRQLPHVTLALQPATLVHRGREKLLYDVSGVWAATHVLWLDSDMSFPPDSALRLLGHDRDVVACNCATRQFPSEYTAVRDNQRVPTLPESAGLEAVDSAGMAVFLMRTTLLRKLARPWFQYGAHENEDGWFCRKLREAGTEILIDHDLSKEVGHVGPFTYRLEHVANEVSCVS